MTAIRRAEDRVHPGEGFGTHPHRDRDVVSYALEGGLEHRDAMGNGGVIPPNGVQPIGAGTGVTHGEFNPSKEEPAHVLQIWLPPARLYAGEVLVFDLP